MSETGPGATPPASTPEPSSRPAWSRRDLLGGILKRRKEVRHGLLRDSGLAGVFEAIRDLVFGYRKVTQEVAEALEAKVLFDDRASELPRDLERRGEFWLGGGGAPPPIDSWDPKRLPEDLTSDDPEVRETAKAAAIRYGDPSLRAALVPLLESERPTVRAAVVEIMGSWGDPETLHFLVRRLQEDPDPGTRVRAVLALKDLADPRAAEPLLAALEDREKMVRLWAGVALKERLPDLTGTDLKTQVEAALARLYAPAPAAQDPKVESADPRSRRSTSRDQEAAGL